MPIRHVINPRHTELSPGFSVRRSLPSLPARSVGPFVFFDHFGPVDAKPGDNHDVRPHPHIGLATVTYMLEGAQLHRDSLGLRATHRAGRGELDDGGARNRPFRAHASGSP